GPLLARSLGAHGRGDLAAITVPLALTPYVLNFGLAAYAAREAARGRPIRIVIGSLGVPLLIIGFLAGLAGIPAASALAEGRETVRILLLIGFALMPLSLIGTVLVSCLGGLERWRELVVSRWLAFAPYFVLVVGLSAVGRLSVAAAGAGAIAGGIVALIPS